MADVFKMLLEGAQKTRAKKATDDKLKSILNNPESSDYQKRKSGKGSDDLFSEFEDIHIGEERDKIDYLSNIEKLSLKELDKKPPKEQLKILKIEYNRLFDKLNTLNQSVSNSERLISDLQMERRSDEEEVRQMKNLIRKVAHLFPGQTDLKETVDRGAWKVDEVFEPIESIVLLLLTKIKQTDELIEEEVGKVKKENSSLKEKILQYKQYINKIEELEQMILHQQATINQHSQVKEIVTSSPVSPIQEPISQVKNLETTKNIAETQNPQVENREERLRNNDVISIEEESLEPNTAEHNPHFSEFFSEFKASFEKMKEDEKIKDSIVETTEFKKEPSSPPSSEPSLASTVTTEGDNRSHSKHPLSPDYIETEKEEVDDLFDDTIDVYLQNLSVQQEYLLTVIGKTGISRNSDLKEFLKSDSLGQQYYFIGKKYNSNALNRDIADLRDKSILSDEQVSYGGKGGGNFNVYELSKTGKSCFKKINNDNPVVPEKKQIVRHHASLEHGYLIKDSANIFRDMGYKVYTDLEDVSIKIDPKHRKVFDFIIENEEGKLMHIEVERGTHTQEDFSYAMDKIYEITKEFYFICPNEQVKNKNTKKKFFTWVTKTLGGIQNADVVLNMTTIEQLRKKQKNLWEVTDLRNVK